MTLDLARLAPSLECGPDGIWFARRPAPVSYPVDGNATCLQVEDHSFWFRHRNRCVVSMVRRFAPQGLFLDIGGGNGYVASGLVQAGISCALLEPGIDGALMARRRGVDPVICARLEDCGLPPNSIATAGMFDVLEHIEDEVGALRLVHALLRPGGRLFLTVPAYAFLHSADDVAAGHFRRYTLARLARAVTAAGFKMEHATYLFAPLPPLVFLRRTIPSLLRLRQGADAHHQTAEHAPGGLVGRLMDGLLDIEGRRIEAGDSVPFGTSCLAVGIRR